MDELDAYRCAKLLLDEHGSDAELQAAMRADAFEAAGNDAGRRAWLQILAAIDELGRIKRRMGEQVQ